MSSLRLTRPSRALQHRISTPPQRQPFLRHALEDEFLAAYHGFDNVRDLDRYRLSVAMIMIFMMVGKAYTRLEPSSRALSISYLQQVVDCSQFKQKSTALCEYVHQDLQADQYAAGISVLLLDNARCVAAFDLQQFDQASDLALENRQGFLHWLVEERGVFGLFDLPFPTDAVPKPMIMDDTEDLEGALRLVALWESMHEVTKASVSKKDFPWTIDELSGMERVLSWTSI